MSTTLKLERRTAVNQMEEFTYTLEELAQAIESRGRLGAGQYYDEVYDNFCALGLMYYMVDGNKNSTLLAIEKRSQNIETTLLKLNDEIMGTPEHRAEVMVIKVRELDLSLGGIS